MSFGTDVLVVNGEVIWSGDEIATVSDADNAIQQCYFRCITDKGESIYFPDYGGWLSKWAAKPYTPENKKEAETEAREILLRVGDENGPGWVEDVIDCQYLLSEHSGEPVKVLFAKVLLRGESEPQEITFSLGGGTDG